jgi:ferredoxin
MKTFPLIRIKGSNEHVMAQVFIALLLLHLPRWVDSPLDIFQFIVIVAAGLLIDVSINFIRYKRPVCGVSAAVTAAMISLLASNISIGAQLSGVAVALILGKHIWGGTGKNIFNPALVGFLFIFLVLGGANPFIGASYLLLPGILLSLQFIRVRPHAAISFIIGSILYLVINSFALSDLSLFLFWGSLVITDPVTVTNRPLPGAIAGTLIALSLFIAPPYIALVGSVLAINAVSYLIDNLLVSNRKFLRPSLKIKKVVPLIHEPSDMVDLTDSKSLQTNSNIDLSFEVIMKNIKSSGVFGFGGAGFSTYEKIITAAKSECRDKHLIINGVECDPGLTHDYWLMRNCSREIAMGIDILCKCIDLSTITLAAKHLNGLNFSGLNLHKVKDIYPAGAERSLIYDVLKLEMSKEAVPAALGILVLNVQTIYYIYKAVYENEKADTRFLTVADLRNSTAKVVKVRLGSKIRDVMDNIYPDASVVFAGGGLMQSHQTDDEDVVDVSVNFIASAELPKYKESPLCSKCGLCKISCPVGLEVRQIADLVDKGKASKTKKYHPEACINCGSCSYTCLAGRTLASRIKSAKELRCGV